MTVDIFILAVLVWAAYQGWRDGFLKQAVSSVGFFVGLVVAALCYRQFGHYLAVNGTMANAFTSIVAFFLLWIVVPIMLGFFANVLTKTLKAIRLGCLNSLAGVLVSMLKYTILLSCVLNAMSMLRIMDEKRTAESHLYEPVRSVLSIAFTHVSDYVRSHNTDDADTSDTVWVELQPRADKQ